MVFDIWVDADSVPKNLRQMILKAASRIGARCIFVADRELADVKTYIADDTFSLRQKAREGGRPIPPRSARSEAPSRWSWFLLPKTAPMTT